MGADGLCNLLIWSGPFALSPSGKKTTSMKTDQDLNARLDELGIDYTIHEHPPVFTVEQAKALRGELEGAHIKNLFLRDKKRRIWLCTVLENQEIDLKSLRTRLGAKGGLSFGSPELLMETLGVAPGSVTPFGVINDSQRVVTVVLDAAIFQQRWVNCHPLRNDQTTALASEDLRRFLEAEGYEPVIIDFAVE